VIGLLIAGNKTTDNGEIASPEMQYLDAVAEFIGTFHENMARYSEQRAMSIGTLEALTAAIDAKDPYTRGHSERVAYLSSEIAKAMGLSDDEAERVRISGLVHDVGKIGVPERVLCKAGRLTDEEFGLIKLHPETGHRILKGITLLEHALGGVLHHHERIDGRGYPHGLKGDAIPLTARIIGLADTFDAMSSNRAYRPAMPREKVLAEIARCAGTQLDAAVVAAFTKVDLRGYDELMTRQATAAGVLVQQAA
jgi:HD-GYP domain-containing protein (c-di-GMP phosphodiesterase class II)